MIRAEKLGWRFADGTVALDGVDLQIRRGEKVLITGPSGCGKSTLLRLIAGLLPAHGDGDRSGSLLVGGADPSTWKGQQRAETVGFVQQEPADQLLTGRLDDEVRFAAVQTGQLVEPRALLDAVGLSVPVFADPQALSGGQQQRLAVAAARSAGAQVLLLDEPLAHLDGAGVRALLASLQGTVVMVEHRVEAVAGWADRVVVLQQGRVVHDGGMPSAELLEGPGLRVPAAVRVAAAGGLDALGPREPRRIERIPSITVQTAVVLRAGVTVVPGRDWRFATGDRVALVGPNGVGKSSAIEALAKAFGERAVWIPQQPALSLFCGTVAEELAYGPVTRGRPSAVTLADFALEGLESRSPHQLSKGQQLRLAVAAGVAAGPEVLLLDEPTAGQHLDAVHTVMEQLDRALGDAVLVFATHDVELALRWATHVVVLGGDDGPPHEVLSIGPLPWLQREQLARGWPLVDLERQLHGPAGQIGSPSTPTTAPAIPEIPRMQRPPPRFAHLVLLGTVGCLAVLLDGAFLLAPLAAAGMLFLLTRPVPLSTRVRLFGALVLITWSTVLSQGLFYGDLPRSAFLQVGPVTLWREGLIWGLIQSYRLVAVSAVGLGIAVSTATHRLVGLLTQARISPVLAFLAALAVQAVPRFGREWWIARTARARRGGTSSGLRVWRSELWLLVPVLRRALLRGHRLAEALDSRGFDVARLPARVALGAGDRLALVGAGAVVASVLGLQLIEGLYRWEVFYDPSLRPLYAWVRQWL